MAATTKPYPFVTNAINLFANWLNHRREMREMREIDGADLARIAHDLSVSPAELDGLVRGGAHASEELPKLLKSLGIDEAALSRTRPVQHDMVRVCAACQQKARCDSDLEAGTSAQHYREYCANAPTIDALSQQT
ncbi:MAG TPA: DUF6455 family protein [Sphingomicrobium sp.]|nr:DUF6455 family protein [Sphingomicrobium sp.]